MVPPLVKQSWVVFGVLLTSMNQGLVLTFPFSLLPGLRAKGSPIMVDLDTASWLASCVGLSMIVGNCFAAFTLDIFGRRNTHAMTLLPGIAGWLIIYFSNNVTMLMIGRLLGGFTNSSSYIVGSIIVGEYTNPEYRGIFFCLKTIFVCMGNLIMHVIGTCFEWRTVALLSIMPLVTSLIINCTFPESPMWLVSRNRFKEGEAAFFYIRGSTGKSVKEFDALVLAQNERISKVAKKLTTKQKLVAYAMNLRKKEFIKPILITLIGFLLMEACGRHIFPAYATDILRDVVKEKNKFSLTLGIDVVTIAGGALATILIKMFKRRTVLFSTGITTTALLFSISLYMFLISNGTITIDMPWLLPLLFILYFTCANFGCTAIPLVLFGELFPLSFRAIGSSITICLDALLITAVLKCSPVMFIMFDIHGTFAILAFIMSLSLLYLYFTLPETRNRTLQEIEDFFVHGRLLDNKTRGVKDDDVEAKLTLKQKVPTELAVCG